MKLTKLSDAKFMQNEKKIVIGLTGGVGCGKSSIAKKIEKVFKDEVQFVFTDDLAHDLMEPGHRTYSVLIKEYGVGILYETGEENAPQISDYPYGMPISRPKLKEAVLNSKEGFKRLNELTHPVVKEETLKIIKNSQCSIIVVEAALLIEAHMTELCDDVWYIYATEVERRNRLKTSRGYSDEYIDNLFKNQLSEEVFKKKTSFILYNHDNQSDVEEQIKSRVDQIRKKS